MDQTPIEENGTHVEDLGMEIADAHELDVIPSLEGSAQETLGTSASGSAPSSEQMKEELDDSDDSLSDSSSSSSSLSSSSPSRGLVGDDNDDDEGFSQPAPLKTKDEVLLEELPSVEEVNIMLPNEAELRPVGTVSSIVHQLVVIQSQRETPALTEDSILFRSDRLSLGKVFEVFGPVSSPLYSIRFNTTEQITNKGLTEGQTVYYAPDIKEYTGYILTQQLKLLKGSDASWKNDHEPPLEALEYSDDEKEMEAKRKMKNTRKKKTKEDNPGKKQQQNFFPGAEGYSRPGAPQFQHQYRMNYPSPYTQPPPMFPPPPYMYHLPPPPAMNYHAYPPPPQPFYDPSFHHWPSNPGSSVADSPLLLLPPPPPPPPPPSE